MRIVLSLVALVALGAGCKTKAAPDPPPAPHENLNPYKNVMPGKVKADVEKINQQHEEKLDKEIEGAKTAQ